MESDQSLPLTLSDLQSPDGTNSGEYSRTRLPHKLEPLETDVVKKRRRTRRSRRKESVEKASGADIESYLNQRMSRLDPMHQQQENVSLDPRLMSIHHENEDSKIFDSTRNTTASPNSIVSGKNESQTSEVGPMDGDVHAHEDHTGDTGDQHEKRERRRRRRQSSRRQEQSQLTSNTETASEMGEIADQPETNSTMTTTAAAARRRALPDPPENFDHTLLATPTEEAPSDQPQGGYRHALSCPNDPAFLVDEEDIREGLVTREVSVTGVQSIESEKKDGGVVIYRQEPETGRFTRVTQRKDGKRRDDEGEEEPDNLGILTDAPSNTRLVIGVHKMTQRLAMGAHGLLAGLSLWNSVVSLTLSQGKDGHVAFLSHYHSFPLALHSLYLLLVFIVVVALLDRLDIAKINRACVQHCIHSLPEIALTAALLLLLLVLMLTATLAFLDERIARFEERPDLWTDVLSSGNTTSSTTPTPLLMVGGTKYTSKGGATSPRVTGWLVVDLTRSVAMLFSWLLALCTSSRDRMEDYLYDLENQTQNELTTPQTVNTVSS